jgi:tetratricopeptide (TPR) repeat protein
MFPERRREPMSNQTAPIKALALPLLVVCLALAFAASALVLAACSNGSKPSTADDPAATQEPMQEPTQTDTVWTAQEAQSPEAFQLLFDEGVSAAEVARGSAPEDIAKADVMAASGEIEELFARGNSAYRGGDYQTALDAYDEILDYQPTHLGANNNMTLVLLHRNENEHALIQACKTLALYPDEYGCILNIQIAAKALGYQSGSIWPALEVFYQEYAAEGLDLFFTDEDPLNGSIVYNSVAQNIEFMSGNDPGDAIQDFRDQLQSSELYRQGDPDALALMDYLDGLERLLDKQ